MRTSWPRLWPWAPVLFAAAYGVVVLAHFSSLILAINQDSDAVTAPVIGKLLGEATHGSPVLLGNHAWYEELWFLRATSGLPGYRQLWDLAPAALSLAALGVLAWSTWRALGAWAAALTASALLCVGAGGRFMFFTFNWHAFTAAHTILLGALLVWLAGRAGRFRVWQLVLIAAVAGAVSAAPATGDTLFDYWAILPMVAAAALLVWRTRSREHWQVLAVAVAVAVIALAGGALLRQAMHDQGWRDVPLKVLFAGPGILLSQLQLLLESYLYLAGGYFFGLPTDHVGASVFLSGVLFLSALIAVAFELRRRSIAADPAPVRADPAAARRLAYVAFWTVSLLLTSAAFVFTSAAVNIESARFLLAGYIAIGALLPVVALRTRGWQAGVVTGVCMFALIASYQLLRQPSGPQPGLPGPQQANALVRLARSQHVKYGYASYWAAADLTWLSYFKVKIYPVEQCTPPSLTLCPFKTVRIDSWYVPRSHTRSMLIIDPQLTQLPLVSSPDPALGKPVLARAIPPLQVYIYPYDIAERFHPAT